MLSYTLSWMEPMEITVLSIRASTAKKIPLPSLNCIDEVFFKYSLLHDFPEKVLGVMMTKAL